jgi:hypothetical protein
MGIRQRRLPASAVKWPGGSCILLVKILCEKQDKADIMLDEGLGILDGAATP